MAYTRHKIEDYIGKKYGYWTITGYVGKSNRRQHIVRVSCKCGFEHTVLLNNIMKKGKWEKSCGCRSKYSFLEGLPKKCCGIYKIVCPNGSIYIGQTKNILTRWRSYAYKRYKNKGDNNELYNSLLNNGANSHKFILIHQLPYDIDNFTLDRYESFYIDRYSECNEVVLNIRLGGLTSPHSKESIEKMKGKNGKWMIGRKISKETILKREKSRKENNKPLSEESRNKYRNAQLGENNTMAKLKIEDVLSIVKIRKEKKTSYKEIARAFNVSVSTISNIFNRGWGNINYKK